jgi:serine phosphatase RsbU (regulator of sigma subunit)
MSLRTKLIVFSVLLALIPVGISGWSMIQKTRDELKDSANTELMNAADDVRQEIEDFYRYILSPLRLIQKTLENESLGPNEKLQLLTEGMKNITELAAIQVSVEGNYPLLVTQDDFLKKLSDVNKMSKKQTQDSDEDPSEILKLEPDEIKAIQAASRQKHSEKDIFPGDPEYLPEADAWLMTAILPLKVGNVSATLSARINLERLKKHIEEHPFAQRGFITLIQHDGHKIFDPKRPDLSDYELVRTVKKHLLSAGDTNAVALYTRPSGEKMLGAYSFPAELNIAVIAEQDEKRAYLAVREMEEKLLMWMLIGFSFAVIAAVAVSVSLTRPLHRLMLAARKIAEGDLSVQIETGNKKDEIGELSLTFNKMVSDLDRYIHELTETTKAKERAESELKLAWNIQQSFLPKDFPKLPEIEVWGKCEPAREVGGDYFDFFQIDDERYGMVVGDVSGKGVPAALFMAVSRTLFRMLTAQKYQPGPTLTEFNDRLVALDQGSNMFITLFYGVINIKTGQLQYSTAGHNMPYLKSSQCAEGQFCMLPNMKTMVAGIMDGMEMETAEIYLSKGDMIVLYTDGMTESISKDEKEFGEERLAEYLNRYAEMSAREICEKLVADVQAFQTGMPQFDDMTMFVMKMS